MFERMFGISCKGRRSDINQSKNYHSTCEENFKERYNNHTASFRNKCRKKSSKLSIYVWKLKINSMNYDLEFSIARPTLYTSGSRKYDLYLRKKPAFIKTDPESLLTRATK